MAQQKPVKRVLDIPLYSTWTFPIATAVGNYGFFVTPVGQTGQGLVAPVVMTQADTNINGQGGQIPAEMDYFIIEAIGFYLGSGNVFYAAAPDDEVLQVHSNYLENGWLEFESGGGQTRIPLGPPKLYPAGCGLVHRSYWTTAAAGAALVTGANNNGLQTIQAIRKLKLREQIVIQGAQSFAINYHNEIVNTNAAVYRATVILYGASRTRLTN